MCNEKGPAKRLYRGVAKVYTWGRSSYRALQIGRVAAPKQASAQFVTQAVKRVAEGTVHRTVYRTPSLDALSKAGQVLDRGGLTKAGRGLAKHSGRSGSSFPNVKGNPSQINQCAQDILMVFLPIHNPLSDNLTILDMVK